MTEMIKLPHLLFLPKDYEAEPDRKWPLILFLHGAGERGNDLELIKSYGIPKVTAHQPDFPFIAVSPQCPPGNYWAYLLRELDYLLNTVIDSYRVDTSRIYLTGLSMGGYGSWYLAIAFPYKFAAVAPICGGGDTDHIYRIRHLPVWAFHGQLDDIVPLAESVVMVNALRKIGGNVKFTIYPGVKHDSWTQTYNNPDLYDWFLQHTNH